MSVTTILHLVTFSPQTYIDFYFSVDFPVFNIQTAIMLTQTSLGTIAGMELKRL